jgi:hypothetical protein
MNQQVIQLIDPNRNVVATGQVAEKQGLFAGEVNLASMPPRLRRLFEEFEEMVSSQVFSVLDEMEDKISSAGLQIVFPDGQEAGVRDLQIYPSTGEISFRSADTSSDGQRDGQF